MDQYNESDTALQDAPPSPAINNTASNNIAPQPPPPQTDYRYQQQHIPQNGIYDSVINSLSGWMKFLGIYTIVIGAITCIGIISAAIGIPLIFAGISLTNASKAIKEYADFNNPNILYNLFLFLKKYFKIQGIMVIVSLALTFLYIVIILVVFAFGAYNYMYNY